MSCSHRLPFLPHAVYLFLHSPPHLASSLIVLVSCSAGVSSSVFTSLCSAGLYRCLLTAIAVRYLHFLLIRRQSLSNYWPPVWSRILEPLTFHSLCLESCIRND